MTAPAHDAAGAAATAPGTDPERRPGAFVEVFRAAALQAGAVARSLQGEVRPRTKPSDDGPEGEALSAADLACQEVLLLRLAEAFPDAAVDAEEDTPALGRFPPPAPNRPLIVLDPIDGTRNYLEGSEDYAVMGAWIDGGVYRASVVHFPARRVTFWALRGGGCHRQCDGGEPEPVTLEIPPPRLLVPPRTPEAVRRHLHSLGYEVVVSRCSAVDAAAAVLQRASAAVNLRRPDRRRAIGFLLTAETGGVVLFRDGPWRGEDPDASGRDLGVHAIADAPHRAASLLDAVH